MDAETAKARYAAAFDEAGQSAVVRRYAGTNPATRTATDVTVRARLVGPGADQIAGLSEQGSRRLLLLYADLEFNDLLPLRPADRLVLNGREYAMHLADLDTRRYGETLLAYEVTVKG